MIRRHSAVPAAIFFSGTYSAALGCTAAEDEGFTRNAVKNNNNNNNNNKLPGGLRFER